MRVWAWVAVAAIGCKGGDDSDDTSGGVDADPHLELTEGLARQEGCETVTGGDGTEIPAAGATRYYAGSFEFNGDEVTGFEYYVLLWTEQWKADNPDAVDCRIAMSGNGGEKVSTSACGSCDFAFKLSVEMDAGLTTCDADFVAYMQSEGGYGAQNLFYNVYDAGGGEAHLFFESGTAFTEGGELSNGGKSLTYLTEPSCVYSF